MKNLALIALLPLLLALYAVLVVYEAVARRVRHLRRYIQLSLMDDQEVLAHAKRLLADPTIPYAAKVQLSKAVEALREHTT